MAKAIITFKLMPESVDIDLEPIKEKALTIAKEAGSVGQMQSRIDPIAFGLKAVIAFFEWPEEKELEEVEEAFKNIENVNSIQITDLRKIA